MGLASPALRRPGINPDVWGDTKTTFPLTSQCDTAAVRSRTHAASRALHDKIRGAATRSSVQVSGRCRSNVRGVALGRSGSATVAFCVSRSWMPEVNRRRSSPTGFVGTCLGRSDRSNARESSFQMPPVRFGNGVELLRRLPVHALGLPWMLAARRGEQSEAERPR
jgi:hypothetical protein